MEKIVLRPEPYDPDARDADNDGIVQERTPWERPAGMLVLDSAGRQIERGRAMTERPAGLRIVDRQGNTVQYTPSYMGKQPSGARGTALADRGTLSLQERGFPTTRSITAPKPVIQSEAQRLISKLRPTDTARMRKRDRVEHDRAKKVLGKLLERVDEPGEREVITAVGLNSLYWAATAFNIDLGAADAITTMWSGSSDADFNPHQVLEDMFEMGGFFAVAYPLAALKDRYNLSKQQMAKVTAGAKKWLSDKKLTAGEMSDRMKMRISSTLDKAKLFKGDKKPSVVAQEMLDGLDPVEVPPTIMSAAEIRKMDVSTPEGIRAKNKAILDAIAADPSGFGSTFGNPSKELASNFEGQFKILTNEERRERYIKDTEQTLRFLRDRFSGKMEPDNASESVSPELRELIMSTDDATLIQMAEDSAFAMHEGMRPTVFVNLHSGRLPTLLEDGSYRTTHEVESRSSDARVRADYEATIGYGRDVSPELRPASGWITHEDWIDDSNPLMPLPKDQELGNAYGGVRLQLRPEVAERTSYGLSDSLRTTMRPVPVGSKDKKAVTQALLNPSGFGGQDNDGSLFLGFLQNSLDGTPSKRRFESLGAFDYTEAVIPGSFTMGEVESVSVPVDALVKLVEGKTVADRRADVAAMADDLFPAERLRDLGATDEEIEWFFDNVRNPSASAKSPMRKTGEELVRVRKMKDFEARVGRYGAKLYVQEPTGADVFDAGRYGGTPGEDAAQYLEDRIARLVMRNIRSDMEESRRPVSVDDEMEFG